MATNQVPTAPADATLAGYLQSIELAVADAYDKIIGFLGEAAKPTATTFQGHHRAYADALAKQAGASAAPGPNPTLGFILGVRLLDVTDEIGALTLASAIEDQVAQTQAFAFTTLTTPAVIHLVATILPMITAHAAILGASAGLATAALFPNGALEGTAIGDGSDSKVGFDPASFPVS